MRNIIFIRTKVFNCQMKKMLEVVKNVSLESIKNFENQMKDDFIKKPVILENVIEINENDEAILMSMFAENKNKPPNAESIRESLEVSRSPTKNLRFTIRTKTVCNNYKLVVHKQKKLKTLY